MIREAHYFVGLDAPAHYFMGQIEQESRCREGVTAFDGGMGLGQFMPSTAADIQERESALQELGVEPMPYDPQWAIRAMILYDKQLYCQLPCEGWYFGFRRYNGGAGNLRKEIRTAGSCDIERVEKACKRKTITLKSGALLDFCKVNIDYPAQIFKKAKAYEVM